MMKKTTKYKIKKEQQEKCPAGTLKSNTLLLELHKEICGFPRRRQHAPNVAQQNQIRGAALRVCVCVCEA